MTHRHEIRPRFYELDPYNHVNHSVYIQYFETARIELLSSIGFGLDRLQQMNRQIVVVRIETSFSASAGAGDELVVETSVGEMRRATTQWLQRIVRGDEVITEQVMTAAMTDLDGKPTRWLPDLVAALSPYAT